METPSFMRKIDSLTENIPLLRTRWQGWELLARKLTAVMVPGVFIREPQRANRAYMTIFQRSWWMR